MDAAVLDQLREGQPRDLAPDAVERREHDRLGRVVDDEVDAGEVLERADVATLAADDPALHVVGGELDERHGRLGGVARGDPLECVGDEVPGAPLGLGLRLLLHLADAAGELVADELLRALEQVRLRLVQRHACDALELGDLLLLRRLQVLLELLRVHLAVGDALLTALELARAPLELGFLRRIPLLRCDEVGLALPDLALDLAA